MPIHYQKLVNWRILKVEQKHMLPALMSSFCPLQRTVDVFSWDSI